MTELAWARLHEDGPSHAWLPDQPTDTRWLSLCGVEAEWAELTETDDHKCFVCVIADDIEPISVTGPPYRGHWIT